MPGFNLPCGSGMSIWTATERVRGSSTGATAFTVPVKASRAKLSTLTRAAWPTCSWPSWLSSAWTTTCMSGGISVSSAADGLTVEPTLDLMSATIPLIGAVMVAPRARARASSACENASSTAASSIARA